MNGGFIMNSLIEFIEGKRNPLNQRSFDKNYYEIKFDNLKNGLNFIYGAGEAAHWVYEIAIKSKKIDIEAFVDKNESIRRYKEYECITIDKMIEIKNKKLEKRINIIVCVGSYEIYTLIKRNLIINGFSNIYYHGYFFELQYLFYNDESKMRKSKWINLFTQNKEKIQYAYECLEDEKSKDLYIEILYSLYYRRAINFEMRPREEQYFPKDIQGVKHQKISKFLILGAYDGDLIRQILLNNFNIEHIYALEPDPKIFKRLKLFVDKLEISDRIDIIEKAIGLKKGRSRFKIETGLGSKISSQGEIYVDVTTIDTLLEEGVIDKTELITLDIEGQELNALRGAKKYIKMYMPDLGVCTYHKPEHLWEIPIEIRKISSSYRINLRNYTSFLTESVYYACNQ